MTDKLKLAELTSEEARRALTADSFLILPMGDYLFAEALALSYATLTALLDDMIAGFLRHGPDRIFIVNGHGNNVAPINEVTMRWRQSDGVMIPVPSTTSPMTTSTSSAPSKRPRPRPTASGPSIPRSVRLKRGACWPSG